MTQASIYSLNPLENCDEMQLSLKKLNVEKSERLYKQALDVLPLGVSSNARLWRGVCPVYTPCSIFIKSARGSHIWDVDGNEYIDYRLGFGPVILGHSYPKVHRRVHQIDEDGLVFALSHQLEISVAKKIREMVPCAEMIRFSNSGTEATMHALRIARAYTGRDRVLKFEGHYHGAHDYLLFSVDPGFEELEEKKDEPIPASAGIPDPIRYLILTLPWNDFEAVENAVKKHSKEIAAIITEPVMGNCCAIPPKEGYLKFLRELCDQYDIVLIFDEVKTGFRLGRGGAQKLFGVTPDLATFAKSLGNGYPIACIAGKRDIMANIGPHRVLHGGTYSGNPVSLAASDATLDELKKDRVFSHLRGFGTKLMKGMADVFEDHGLNFHIFGFPEMFQFVFSDKEEIWSYRDLKGADFDTYAKLHYELLKHGVMIDQDNEEPCFTCYSHKKEDLENTLTALDTSLKAIGK